MFPSGGCLESLREDDHLSLLSSELKRLDIGIAALSEVRRPDCGEIMAVVKPPIDLVALMVTHTQGFAVAVPNKPTPMIMEATSINERIMRIRIRHSLCVASLVSVYASTEASDVTEKDAFYASLESVVDQCPGRDNLLVFGDFIASTGTDGDV